MSGIKTRLVRKARIEIIPLIDVIFFLLATFVLFTLSLNRIGAVPLDLPKAPLIPPDQPLPEIVTVQVAANGALYWNQEAIDRRDLLPLLQDYVANEPDPKVLVAGDDKALYGPAIEVLDAVRSAGIGKVSVETRTRPTGR